MNILIVLDNLSDRCGANVEIMLELAAEWSKAGHNIYGITKTDRYRLVSTYKSIFF